MRKSNLARWWKGHVRRRQDALLAAHQPACAPRMRMVARAALWLHACAFLFVLSACLSVVLAQAIPRDALRHQLTLKREAQHAWGLGAPVATFAAQVHQESRWRETARSPVGAVGLAQFMPATSQWIGGLYASLGERAPTNPVWALRALVTYDKWLLERIKAADDCERMAFVLAAYNAGLGTVKKKLRTQSCTASGCNWFGEVELSAAGQSPDNHAQTRHYAQVILWRFEPMYEAAGWGVGVCP